jgi:hypothetical protein
MYDMGISGASGKGSGSDAAGGQLAIAAIKANAESIERVR